MRKNDKILGKLPKEIRDAIMLGDKLYRSHTNAIQAFDELPDLVAEEVVRADDAIRAFYSSGGDMKRSSDEEGNETVNIVKNKVSWTIIYDNEGTHISDALVNNTRGDSDTDTLAIGVFIRAHIEYSKWKYIETKVSELLNIINNDDAKNVMEGYAKQFSNDDLARWMAASQAKTIFDLDIDKELAEV